MDGKKNGGGNGLNSHGFCTFVEIWIVMSCVNGRLISAVLTTVPCLAFI